MEKTMKSLFAIILMLLMATLAHAVDSELALFDEAQSADMKFTERENEAWKRIDLQSAQYHLEWRKVYDRRNELYEVNKNIFDNLESDLMSMQQSLQKRMDAVRAIRAQHPAADSLR